MEALFDLIPILRTITPVLSIGVYRKGKKQHGKPGNEAPPLYFNHHTPALIS
jgi:hypothetical protein